MPIYQYKYLYFINIVWKEVIGQGHKINNNLLVGDYYLTGLIMLFLHCYRFIVDC